MINLILVLILAVIIGAAVAYIYKAKKSGAKCIGCPDSKTCSSGGGSCSGNCSGGCSGCAHSQR